jgi:basic amino acid/polyamine antiporter, APA family
MAVAPQPAASPTLVRGLTLIPAAAILVTNVIGSGVFVKARVMTCNVGTPGLVLAAYALAGVFTIAGALTYAELSAMMPRAGGHYNFIGAAFGRVWAFLYGWMQTFIDGAAGFAAIAIVFVIFFNDLLGGVMSPGQATLATVATLAVVTALNLGSVHANGQIATLVTALKIGLVALIGLGAFLAGDGSWGYFGATAAGSACSDVASTARFGIGGFSAAVVGALWSYNGWSAVSFVAEEVDSPGRTLPRALIGGTVLVLLLYVLVNAAFFYVLGPLAVADLPESASVGSAVVVKLLGAGAASLLVAGMMLSTFGALHASLLSVARVTFAMARDGLLPGALAEVSPRSHVPRNAILLLGASAAVFALGGGFDLLTDLIVFMLLLFNGMAVAAVYVLRRRLPDAPRPYRVWGYPLVPAIFLAATAFLMLNTLVATPGRALAGLGIVALGLPVYWFFARRLPPPTIEDWTGR